MADQQLTDPIAAVLNTISDQLVKLSENQKVLNDSQHGLLEKYQEEARMWPNAAALKGVSDEREGRAKAKAVTVFWTVGVDEIPGE